jgi:hypothetical protein
MVVVGAQTLVAGNMDRCGEGGDIGACEEPSPSTIPPSGPIKRHTQMTVSGAPGNGIARGEGRFGFR